MPLDPEQFADVVATAIQAATAPLLARIVALEARGAVMGRDGRDGLPGPAGEKGLDGKDGVSGRDGKDGIDGLNGKDGAPGLNGKDGIDGLHGKDGAPGLNGKDGIDGLRGKDGAPGLNGTLDQLKVVQSPDLRTISLCFKSTGEPIEGGTFVLPVVLDRGVWKEGTTYQAGDGVTWAGSFWIAQAETIDKPGDGATAYRLAVKAGREGKPGRDGKDLREPPVVKL